MIVFVCFSDDGVAHAHFRAHDHHPVRVLRAGGRHVRLHRGHLPQQGARQAAQEARVQGEALQRGLRGGAGARGSPGGAGRRDRGGPGQEARLGRGRRKLLRARGE